MGPGRLLLVGWGRRLPRWWALLFLQLLRFLLLLLLLLLCHPLFWG